MKKLRRLTAAIAVLGIGIGAAACTSPVAPDSQYDIGSNSYDIGSNSYDIGSNSYDIGSNSYDIGSNS